jgi:16S rRNA (guanine527-N7)-methyltransferase
MDTLLSYFPSITEQMKKRYALLQPLYAEWNSRINVISRKDMDAFYLHHVLHSLSIAKVISFKKGTRIMDVGTGGGFPGIPLAIMFPETSFLLVDSIGKKIKVVQAVIEELGLANVKAVHARAEDISDKFDFVVSRAVTALPRFIPMVDENISKSSKHELTNGILYLKGGDVEEELAGLGRTCEIFRIQDHFTEDYFSEKWILHIF